MTTFRHTLDRPPKIAGQIYCNNCGRPYPEQGAPYACGVCGGIYDFWGGLPEYAAQAPDPAQPWIWRYRHTFGLPADAPVLTAPLDMARTAAFNPINTPAEQAAAAEGRIVWPEATPLVWTEAFGRKVALKLEYFQPSGSFKDRGVAVMLSFLQARGVTAVVEDSSGNAGAAVALYARAAGMQAQVYVPEYASGPKRAQIEAYGAELVPIPGARSDVTEAVRRAAAGGAVYASHASQPHLEAGYATLAYELVEQLGGAPGTVIIPVGQGGLLLGAASGFENLRRAGQIERVPRLVGVQARQCAPLWAVSTMGRAGLQWVTEGQTLAEGVRVLRPVRGDRVLAAVEASDGAFLAVDEEAILPGRDELAQRGFKVEPTTALVWDALANLGPAPDPVVLVLTGAGFKSAA